MKVPAISTAGTRRFVLPVALAAGALAGLAGPAAAHVTVNPSTAETGGYGQLSFRVPNESAAAATTRLQVVFPTDSPLAFVAVRPTPGWTATVQRAKLPKPVATADGELTEAVSRITWTGGSIKPGEYQDFDIQAGPFPDRPTEIAFKALQTYSDGEIVRWIDVARPGAEEPERPAPVLKVQPAATAGVAGATGSTAAAPADGSGSATWGYRPLAGDTTGRILGAGGLLAGLAALAVTLAGRRRSHDTDAAQQQSKQPTRV